MLTRVGKFNFPVDFIVIDIEEDKQVPLLLGRPFLETRAALIDVKKGELTLRVGDEAVHFNLNHSLKQPEFINADCESVETKIPINSEHSIIPTRSSLNQHRCFNQYFFNLLKLDWHLSSHSNFTPFQSNLVSEDAITKNPRTNL